MKAVWIYLAFGILFLGIALVLAIIYSYDVESLGSLFAAHGDLDRRGLLMFVTIGYGSITGSVISGMRYLFSNPSGGDGATS
jgi:hypothetical protein